MTRVVMGKDAHIDLGSGLATVGSEWSFTWEADVQQEGVFGGAGKKKTWTGQEQLNGSVTIKVDRDTPPEVAAPVSNTQVTLKLYDDYVIDPDAYYEVPAKIVSFAESANARAGLPTEVVISWQSDGDWTLPTRAIV